MKKEEKFQKKWDLENKGSEEDILEEEEPPKKSSAAHFIEEKLRLKENPYDIRGNKKAGFTTEELLYSGVTKEFEGRYAYLKNRQKEWPQDKYDYPIAESQEVGWTACGIKQDGSSPFARKP